MKPLLPDEIIFYDFLVNYINKISFGKHYIVKNILIAL